MSDSIKKENDAFLSRMVVDDFNKIDQKSYSDGEYTVVDTKFADGDIIYWSNIIYLNGQEIQIGFEEYSTEKNEQDLKKELETYLTDMKDMFSLC